ncbi:hypothetical protein J2J97_02510 [Rhizobium bangladeshense]|uniref:AbiTii domain-containing protein n=1 Tax=Rhizobium bangladeshense TaxID=1138189 RepID=UPI001A97E65C|nr:hypothetical protein [Rhizobium bangladeshense]QSY94837.1 hypothetical protein J2J97_02510 [Rhizobium bangladeshense]
MGLLADIQNDAVSDTASVASLLRKCLVLAHHLDSALLEDWVKWELNGYPGDTEVPEYRIMELAFRANVHNAAYQHNNFPVPQYVVAKATNRKDFSKFICRQAIGTIFAQDMDKIGALNINFDNVAILVQQQLEPGTYVTAFWGQVPTASVIGVLDAVRNRVLEFVLAVQKKYPGADDVAALTAKEPSVEKEIKQIFQTTINGNAGIVGSAHHSTVNITVNTGNLQDLRNQLGQHGVNEEDLAELEVAVKSEPSINRMAGFGPKVTQWVGKMVGKAASGAWAVGLGASGALLEKALLGYYGYQ